MLTHAHAPTRRPRGGAGRPRLSGGLQGWTLLEILIALALLGLIGALVYPSLQPHLLDMRRADGRSALLRLQADEWNHRMQHEHWATLAELNRAPQSDQGHYELRIQSPDPRHPSLVLEAWGVGLQAFDTPCRLLRVVISGISTWRESGPSPDQRNPLAQNRLCWGGL